jgi:hypothetical protein
MGRAVSTVGGMCGACVQCGTGVCLISSVSSVLCTQYCMAILVRRCPPSLLSLLLLCHITPPCHASCLSVCLSACRSACDVCPQRLTSLCCRPVCPLWVRVLRDACFHHTDATCYSCVLSLSELYYVSRISYLPKKSNGLRRRRRLNRRGEARGGGHPGAFCGRG